VPPAPTSGSMSKVKIGAKKDGTIVAAKGTYWLQAGAFPGSPIRGAAGCAFGPYDIENAHTVGFDVVSNRSKVRGHTARPARRSAPMPSNACWMRLAEKLKMDPHRAPHEELRQAGHQGSARSGLSGHGATRRR